jgi:hypothetical protein
MSPAYAPGCLGATIWSILSSTCYAAVRVMHPFGHSQFAAFLIIVNSCCSIFPAAAYFLLQHKEGKKKGKITLKVKNHS